MQLELKAYGKAGVYANKIIATNYIDASRKFEFGFNALVAGVNAVLKLGGVDVVNYKYEKTLIDKEKLWPD